MREATPDATPKTSSTTPDLHAYGAIGFSLESLVCFKIEELSKHTVECFLYELHRSDPVMYPAAILSRKHVDYKSLASYSLQNAVFDITNGLVLQLAAGRRIEKAVRGLRPLTTAELKGLYGEPPVFRRLEYPASGK